MSDMISRVAERLGSFDLFGPSFLIGDRAVVVARRWTPIVLVAALPVGIWMIAHSLQWQTSTVVSWQLAYGGCGVGIGIVGLALSPLRPPARIACTADGLVVGRRSYAKEDVLDLVAVPVRDVVPDGKYSAHTEYRWALQITVRSEPGSVRVADVKTVSLRLTRTRSAIEPSEVADLVSAMRAMLAMPAPAPPP
jgi:hypothetical protein